MKSSLHRIVLSVGMVAAAVTAIPVANAQMQGQADPAPYGNSPPPRTSQPGMSMPEDGSVRREEARELNREGRLVPKGDAGVQGNKVERADRATRRAQAAERRQRARAANAERSRRLPNPEKGGN